MFFAAMWVVWRYQLLYVFQPAFDLQGALLPPALPLFRGCSRGCIAD